MDNEKKILRGICYNVLGRSGPESKYHYPEGIFDDVGLSIIAVKCITLLTGDEGKIPERIAVVPFTKHHLLGIVYHFEVVDPASRGGVLDSNIALLFNEKYSSIAYKYSDLFQALLEEIVKEIKKYEQERNEQKIRHIIKKVYEKLLKNLESLREAEEKALKPPPKKIHYKFKVVVIGDGKVGKTTMLLRYVDNCFQETYLPTIGVNVSNKNIVGDDNKIIRLNFYDVAGQEKFKLMRRVFYEGADAAIIMYDVTNKQSLANLENWINDVAPNFPPKKLIGLIIGNKIDLKINRVTTIEDVKPIAKKFGLDYIETSAKTGENINKAFSKLAKIILKNKEPYLNLD